MTTKPEPYPIFNDAFSIAPRARAKTIASQFTTFWPFPRLSIELRTKIWAECIPARRFIHVFLDNDRIEKFPELYTTKNELGNIISGCPYRMRVAGSDEWSPDTLVRVNHEASSEFRRICRVRIPLPVKGGDGSVKSLYISPENDTIWAVCDQNSCTDPLLVSFLHDLVAYDPKGIGVIHLCIGGTTMNDIYQLGELDPSLLQLPPRQSITKLLSSSLQTFHPVVSPINGRCMLGCMSSPHAQFHYNRSIPIFPRTQSYTSLEYDPRPIKADLTHVAVNTDPRRTVFLWNRFKANFGIERHINIRYILSIAPPKGPPIASRSGFVDRLQKYDDHWADWTAQLGQQVWGERMSKEEYEAQRISLPQAAGFWTFPQEAFGDVPGVNMMSNMGASYWEAKMVKDLSKFHPEIWVFNLP